MKINSLIGGIASISLALIASSCDNESYYDMGGQDSRQVNFSAVNLDVTTFDDFAESSRHKNYDNLPYIDPYNNNFLLPRIVIGVGPDGKDIEDSYRTVRIERESVIWSGGYNDIEITFKPSNPEEKEATFTMPDGTIFNATVDEPTFIWTPDSTYGEDNHFSVYDTFIKAESHYTIGKTVYNNFGYIFVDLYSSECYNKETKKWYYAQWYKGESPSVESYVKFTVENLTVGNADSCVSCNNHFPETQVVRNDTVEIPFVGYEGNHNVHDVVLNGNDFLMLGNTDVRFTFIPEYGQEEMILSLPDGSHHVLTVDNPSYVWRITRDEVRDFYYYRDIYGRSSYTKDGITFDCNSYVTMRSMTVIWYDEESREFLSDYWR